MQVTLSIQRFNPEAEIKSYSQDFPVEVEPTDRVLDALIEITRNQDGTLGFRKSCAHGVCGSDAMRINGKERLACKTLFKDILEDGESKVSVEPMRHLEVQKDLMVDQAEFFQKYRSVKPYFIPKADPTPGEEFLQSPEDRALFDEATKCINCQACYSACPVMDKNPNFVGPQAIVAAARFIYDSRDQGLEARIDELDTPDGIWPCESHFECTRVCPREIKITKLINITKREIKKYRQARGEQTAEERAQQA